MAKALTGTFTISQTLTYGAAGAYTTEPIAIGSLIDVGDAQALEIESVDYIFQSYDTVLDTYTSLGIAHPFATAASGSSWGAQLTDRNSAEFLSAADNNLISSAGTNMGADGTTSHSSDFYPDDFQRNAGRFVVNDELYLIGRLNAGTPTGNAKLMVSVRVRAKVVKLSTRDWMAISLETVQNE
jgi:hypothetical protein